MRQYKLIFLSICRLLGAFRLAKYLTRKKFRVLCYHGFSLKDEHEFHPQLFMRAETLASRLQTLKKEGFNVMPLGELLKGLEMGGIPDHSVAITVDDGWKGVHSLAQPVFMKYNMPWMLYLTTYYVENNIQVINIALRYILWKTVVSEIRMADFIPNDSRTYHLSTQAMRNEIADTLYIYCDALDKVQERQKFVNDVADKLGLDWQSCLAIGMFKLITADECRELHEQQVDIQLHTHRHSLPENSQVAMADEIEENRAFIEQIHGFQAVHLCYPSGRYTQEHLKWLPDCGINSATTCKAGLNDTRTPALELLRFLDGEHIHPLEFEAEVSGFKHLLQKFKRGL